MSSRNTVLLIVKQSPGIDYNELLSKIAGNYSNINSARAALSRTLKDLSALGLIVKKSSRVFLTNKGKVLLGREMKNKLILKLNDAVLFDEDAKNIESIVQYLSTTIQRSEKDKDLLNVARDSISFFVADLENIESKLEEKTKKFEYMKNAFSKQINTLRELNFRDSFGMNWSREAKNKIIAISKKIRGKEIFVESNNEYLLKIFAENLNGKKKGNDVFFQKEKLPELLDDIEKEIERVEGLRITLFLEDFKIAVRGSALTFSGPWKKLKKVKPKKQVKAAVV